MAARRLVTDHSVSHERYADAVTQGRIGHRRVTLQRHPGPGPGRECGSPRAAPVQPPALGPTTAHGTVTPRAEQAEFRTILWPGRRVAADTGEYVAEGLKNNLALKRSTQPQAYWAADLTQPCGRAASVWVGRAAGLGNLVLRDP
eukprot:222625-Hanusia_phi.AAC.1